MKNNVKKLYLVLLVFCGMIYFVPSVVAVAPTGTIPVSRTDLRGNIMGQLDAGAKAAELGNASDPREIVALVIRTILALVGTIFFVQIVYSGYQWLVSHGEEDKLETAKKTIVRSVVGLFIVLSAYAVTVFIGKNVQGIFLGDQKEQTYDVPQ